MVLLSQISHHSFTHACRRDVSSNPSPRGSVQDLRPCRPQYDGTGTIAGISYGNYTPSKFLHGPLPDAHLYPDGIYLTGIRPSAVAA